MKRIVLTGGGTAGHVTPHLALLPHLIKEGYEIHYIGTQDGIEHKMMDMPGIAYHDVRLTDYQSSDERVQGLDNVDQWSVGFMNNGVFHAQASAARRKHTPALPDYLQLPQLRGTPAILIVDVFGNRTVWTYQED